ncbi:MAG: response regulator [Candidatus Omnitrophica bacterium]|nr:response regulator [Candidatus Omnitrophota bacterium]
MKSIILLIDDEPDILKVVVSRLKNSGYKVLTTADAEGALSLLEKQIPDLILLDLILPNMQGDELCKILKNDPKFKDIPVILFTASVVHVPEIVKESGADDYVIKPFEPEELLEKIEKLLK